VQNSTAVFQLNISNKTSFCASISRPNAKPRNDLWWKVLLCVEILIRLVPL